MLRPVQLRRWVSLLVAGAVGIGVGASGRAADGGMAASPDIQTAPAQPLRRIADVKTWSAWAEQGLAVDIDGVVTCTAPSGNFFLQDAGVGIHVVQPEPAVYRKPGDRVRVRGVTRRGAYAPAIEPREIVPLGRGELPAPRRATYNEVASGTLDGQLLELDGVICDVSVDPATRAPVLNLATDGRRLRATVYGGEPVRPETLIDAEVRLRGVASGSFNRQRQLVEPVLRVPDAAFVTVLRPAPADAFAAPVLPLARLLGFSLEAPGPHRVRIQGSVTRQVSARELFVRGDGRGLRIQTREPVRVAPGDDIEAVGFPAMIQGAAVLENAWVRTVAPGRAPEPQLAHGATFFDGTHTGDLVKVRARLVDWVTAAGESATLILQHDHRLFRGTVNDARIAQLLPEKGSIVDLTGICATSQFDAGMGNTPAALVLLLADAGEITVIQRPDWWTPSRLWRALGVVLLLLLSGLGWVWALRRQVRRKAAIIEQQARHAAVLEERSRIARDLHDTIEQGLTGLSLQLKVVEMDCETAPQNVARSVETARQMLRQSRALAHNAIRELRTDDFARGAESLAEGLRRIAETWTQSGIGGMTVTVDGPAVPLPASTERHLLHIAAEAVTNAVKHGQATAIALHLHYAEGGARLEVRDNGRGFDPERVNASRGGGFGLVGMRERAAAAGATLDVQSQPGGGTAVRVEVPARAPADRPAPTETGGSPRAVSIP